MKELEQVLDLTVHLGKQMMASGQNTERAEDLLRQICGAYRLRDVTVRVQSGLVAVSARNEAREYASRETAVAGAGIDLTRLCRLEALAERIARETPAPGTLQPMLWEAKAGRTWPPAAMALGQAVGIGAIALLLGGGLWDTLLSAALTFGLFWLRRALAQVRLERMLVNTVSMLLTALIAEGAQAGGLPADAARIISAVCIILVPGIGLVNATRNLLCGQEQNGVIQLVKALLETLALAAGAWLGTWIIGGLGL